MGFLRRHRVGVGLLGLVVLLGTLVAYRLKDQQARAVPRARPDVLVGVVTPERRDLDVKLSFTADLLPAKQAAIFSKASGYLRRVHVDRGDFVESGQLLAEIDDLELQAQLEQARASLLTGEATLAMTRSSLEGQRANLESQRANLARARAVADNDARQAERMKTLFERGLVSATEWENARTTADAARASVQAAEAQLRLAEAQIVTTKNQILLSKAQIETHRAGLHLAQTNLSNTRLLSPFDGYISQRNLDPGTAVSAQSSGTNTSSVGILTIQDISSVKVQIEVPERDIARVALGSRVRLTVDPYEGETFGGSVGRIVHALDPRTRTMGVEVDVPNSRNRLKPGMFARVEVLVETRHAALTIPTEAVSLADARPQVMVVRKGAVEPVAIQLGASDTRGVEVVRGLAEGDEVILQGKDLVKAGQRVRTVPAGKS